VDGLAEFFAIDKPRLKSYRRVGDRVLIPSSRVLDSTPPPLPMPRPAGTLRNAHHAGTGRESSRTQSRFGVANQALLGLPFGVVVIDPEYDIHFLNSEARRMFGIHTTALDQDFIHLIHHFDAVAVRGVIDEARASQERTDRRLESLESATDARRTVEITCTPHMPGEDSPDMLFVLTAIDVTEREKLRQQQGVADSDVGRLVKANEEVLAANQDLANTIARLRARNEELLVSVEEIQAATEEVETLNEELQASNEEMETLNEELQATVEELNTTTSDLQARTTVMQSAAIEAETTRRRLRAIVNGLADAVVVVDGDGALLLENTAYATLMANNQDAVMVDSSHKPIPDHRLPLQRAARGEAFSMRFAFGQSDYETWYLASGNAQATEDGATLGVVTIREESSAS
ncbi:MAG: PAS domain S-box protein, partial [Chloroflexia bacterium]|nr:PAS domain S-box protein [Chloroflexia bacterium]